MPKLSPAERIAAEVYEEMLTARRDDRAGSPVVDLGGDVSCRDVLVFLHEAAKRGLEERDAH